MSEEASHFRNLLIDLSKAYNIIKEDGPRKGAWRIALGILRAPKRYYLNYCGRVFDSKYHVQTSQHEDLSALTVFDGDKKGGVHYEPTPVPIFPFLLANLPRDLSEYVFIDFGSGKGRAVLLASHYGFKKIIGVEFANELCITMHNNIRRYRNPVQRCFDIDVVCMDAAKFSIPLEKCVLFFFSPFDKTILEKVLQNIELSYIAEPRKLYVIFYNPNMRNGADELFGESGIFRKTSNMTKDLGFNFLYPVATYESDELIGAGDMRGDGCREGAVPM